MKTFAGANRESMNRFNTGPFDTTEFNKLLETRGTDYRPHFAAAACVLAVVLLLLA